MTGARVSGRYRSDYINDIRFGLDSENMEMLKNSCFGAFPWLESNQPQSQLINLMYKHIVPESIERRRIAFMISDKEIEFGPVEFCTVTGLRMGPWLEPPRASRIHSETFGGKEVLFVKDIHDAFTNESVLSKGRGAKVLKLAMLLILYSCLLMRRRTSKRIEVQYMHLADDLVLFDRFPWGKVAYDFLVVASHNCKTLMDKKLSREEVPTLDAYGFTFAIQVFVYEVHTHIARDFALQVPIVVKDFPRMLKWRANRYLRDSELMAYFDKTYASSVNPIKNNQEELKFLEELGSFNGSAGKAPDRMFLHHKILERGTTTRNRKRCGDEDENLGDASNKGGMMELISEMMSDIKRKVDEICMNQRNEMMRAEGSTQFARGTSTKPLFEQSQGTTDGTEIKITPRCYDFLGSFKGGFVEEPMQLDGISRDEPKTLSLGNERNNNAAEAARIRKYDAYEGESSLQLGNKSFKGQVHCHAVIINGTSERREVHLSPRMHDEKGDCSRKNIGKWYPLSMVPMSHIHKFKKWLSASDEYMKAIKPYVAYMGPVDGGWFEAIWEDNGLLGSDHVDALVNHILLDVKQYPDVFRKKWTVIEQLGWETLSSSNMEKSMHRLLPYVEGRYPRDRAIAWQEIDKVYGIGHVKPQHWVCYELDLTEQEVIVYDSLPSVIMRQGTVRAFKHVLKNVPVLLERANIWGKIGRGRALKTTWNMKIFEGAPQQTNGSDCGVLATKYLQCLLSGEPVTILRPKGCTADEFAKSCRMFRKSFCVELAGKSFIESFGALF